MVTAALEKKLWLPMGGNLTPTNPPPSVRHGVYKHVNGDIQRLEHHRTVPVNSNIRILLLAR